MNADLAGSANIDREHAILTAPPRERLVVTLYDGACRSLEQAAAAMRAGDIGDTHVKLRRGEAIISHLQNTLDMQQGDIAQHLLTIYGFCRRHLNRARIERDPQKVDDVVRLLGQLRDAWNAIRPG
jgi:flagellar protein FliS